MKHRRLRFTLLALSLLLFAICVSRHAVCQQGGYRVAGKVVNAITGNPLDRARVTVANVRDPRETYSVITGEDGSFSFAHLRAGKFSLGGVRRGFIDAMYDQHETYSTAIVTAAGLDSENLVLRLTPEAVIAGKIFDEAGEPVRDANVHLYRAAHNTGVTRIQRRGQSTTDDQGKYEFADLPAGDYFVSVTAKPWYALRPANTRMPDGRALPSAVESYLDVAYPTTYYSDVSDSDEATPIPLRGGERLSIDLHLRPSQALRLTVHVIENSEHGVSIPMLRRRVFDSSEFAHPESVSQVSPGLMELSGIPAGKYTVIYPDRETGRPGKGTEIDVTTDGQELDAAKEEGFTTLNFQVRIPGEPRVPSSLGVILVDSDRRVVAGEQVNGDDKVSFAGVAPGKYTVLASGPRKGYEVVSIEANGVKSPGHGIEVSPEVPVTGTLFLVGGATNVEGVAEREGKPSSGAMVVLVPKDPENNRELFLRDQSDLDGTFALPNVVPGNYTIVAIENGWDLDWSQPGVIAHYLPKGESIRVNPGEQESISLPHPVEVQPR